MADSVNLDGSGTTTATGTPKVIKSVALSGSGTISGIGKPLQSSAVSGSGTLTATGLKTVRLSGAGVLGVSSKKPAVAVALGLGGGGSVAAVAPLPLVVSLDTAEVDQAPAALVVTITNGAPGGTYTLSTSGPTTVADFQSGVFDDAGTAMTVSAALPALSAGSYYLVVAAGNSFGSAAFTVLNPPLDVGIGPKPAPTPPVTAPTQRWRLFSLDGLTSYTFSRNPKSWTNVHPPNDFTHDNTTAPDGQILTWQAASRPWRMEFTGWIDTQAEYEAFEFWASLRRRFWLVDHRNRAWLLTFEHFDAQARIKPNLPWAHDYTVKTLVFAQGTD